MQTRAALRAPSPAPLAALTALAMNRRAFVTGLGAMLAAARAVEAQQARVPRLGVLSPFSESFGPSPSFNAFRQRLRELGWTEGQNITFEYRWADVKADRLPSLAGDLARLHVDVIFAAYGTPAALAATNATRTIPIVFANSGDAIGAGLVPSLAHPGGNVTGTTFLAEETTAKRLELLKEVVPKLARVGVVVNPTTTVSAPVLKSSETPARALGIHLQVLRVQAPEDFLNAIEAAGRERTGGIVVLSDPLIIANQARLLELAATHRLPAIYHFREFTEAGGLMSYGPNLAEMDRRAAYLIDKILRGAKPADLPIEQPTKFELVINMKTAKALGLTIPQSLLLRADQVIE